MKPYYFVTPVILISFLFTPAFAYSPLGNPHPWPDVVSDREAAVTTLVAHYADQYHVSPARQRFIIQILKCENKDFDPSLQSRIIQQDGTREESYGLAQIHLPSHPGVSHTEATDAHYSIEFIVHNVADGRENMWTCARMLKERGNS